MFPENTSIVIGYTNKDEAELRAIGDKPGGQLDLLNMVMSKVPA